MKIHITKFAFLLALATLITLAQDSSEKAAGGNWASVMIETEKGFWPLRKYDEAATKHLREYDPSFAFQQRTAWIRGTEVAIEYSNGLGKKSFTVCMDRDFKILGVKTSISLDATGDPSAVSAPRPSLCE